MFIEQISYIDIGHRLSAWSWHLHFGIPNVPKWDLLQPGWIPHESSVYPHSIPSKSRRNAYNWWFQSHSDPIKLQFLIVKSPFYHHFCWLNPIKPPLNPRFSDPQPRGLQLCSALLALLRWLHLLWRHGVHHPWQRRRPIQRFRKSSNQWRVSYG